MDSIDITHISGKNFHSFEEFEFPIVPGRHLVIGEVINGGTVDSNGAGKSTIFESIPWTIWRKSIRDKDSSRDGKGNCYTSMDFTRNGINYKIERFWKDSKEGNNVRLLANGGDISARKKASVDEEIQEVISYSPDLFISTVVVLQGLPVNFSTLTATVRKSIVEEMLGFSVWDSMRTKFGVYLKKVQLDKSQIDGELSKIKQDMISLNAKIETIKKVNSQQKDTLIAEMADAKAQFRTIMQNLQNTSGKIKELYGDKTLTQYRSDVAGLNTSLKILSNRKETLSALVESNVCPECGQQYPMDKIVSAQSELDSIGPKIDNLQTSVSELSKTINEYDQLLKDLQRLELNKNGQEYTIQTLSNKIQSSNTITDTAPMEEELNNLLASVNDLNTQSTDIQMIIENIKYIDNLLIPSSNFRTKVLEKYIDYINTLIDSVAPLLFNDVVVHLKVDSRGSGLEIDVVRKNNPIPYKSLSGGEKRRLDIIIILAFQRFLMESAGVGTNILVFDEIFDNLDKKGVENVLNSIDSLFPESMCQYVITHNSSLRSMFSSVVKVVKENGISRIEYLSGGE